MFSARVFDQVGGVGESRDLGFRPQAGEHFGAVAGTASEVDDAAYRRDRDARGQVAARARTLLGEFQVLPCVPGWHSMRPRTLSSAPPWWLGEPDRAPCAGPLP